MTKSTVCAVAAKTSVLWLTKLLLFAGCLTLNVLCRTIPHKLCRFELKYNYAWVTMLRLDIF